jgi:hypothetical protein
MKILRRITATTLVLLLLTVQVIAHALHTHEHSVSDHEESGIYQDDHEDCGLCKLALFSEYTPPATFILTYVSICPLEYILTFSFQTTSRPSWAISRGPPSIL